MYERRPWREDELGNVTLRLVTETDERIAEASEEVPLSWFITSEDTSWFGEPERYKEHLEYWYNVADMVIADWNEVGLHIPVSKARQIVETERKLFLK